VRKSTIKRRKKKRKRRMKRRAKAMAKKKRRKKMVTGKSNIEKGQPNGADLFLLV
jgi:hypothetical protein